MAATGSCDVLKVCRKLQVSCPTQRQQSWTGCAAVPMTHSAAPTMGNTVLGHPTITQAALTCDSCFLVPATTCKRFNQAPFPRQAACHRQQPVQSLTTGQGSLQYWCPPAVQLPALHAFCMAHSQRGGDRCTHHDQSMCCIRSCPSSKTFFATGREFHSSHAVRSNATNSLNSH